MAGSSLVHAVNVPVRSISLPSRLQLNSIETELNELETFGVLSGVETTQGGGETICAGFTRLAKLYNNIEEVIRSPFTHQALHHRQNVEPVEEALNDSVGLLDACGTARDLITMMKEQVQDLQSALRRRGRVSSIGNDIHAYISFRKTLKKDIAKSLRILKRLESNNNVALPLFDVDCHLLRVVKSLKKSNAVAISMFRSLLSFLSMPVMKTKAGGWSLISKLIPVAADRNQKLFNEVGAVDFTLYALRGRARKNDAKFDAGVELMRLETLCATIEGLEEGLDLLFRCLIKLRVSLLNILTP
ncbi:hypothetical protein like AT4G35660 [Hibiscus trionum]|uniref:Uncharacterized protein n=1 Tax=Hibiscus trionum TaxID=183268 RepID=A0A9W7H0P4_HIBTR|nr:hypothetical protein like AT4G35660 [Hibiscus trionum]